MLVDRNLILDLIDLESKRENGYRHPHCIIVTLARALSSIQKKKKGKQRIVYEEHPCTDIWINRGNLDSNSWFVLFLCVLMLCSWMVASCHTFDFICCVCDFMVELKSKRVSEWVSIVSLIEPEDSCKECSRMVHNECIDRRVQLEIAFVLIPSKVQIGIVPCKECTGQGKVSGLRT